MSQLETQTGCIVTVYKRNGYDRASREAFAGRTFLHLRMADPKDGRWAEVSLTREERVELASLLMEFDDTEGAGA